MPDIKVEVSAGERTRLETLLGPDADVDRIARIVMQAGAQEALDYATGTAVFSTMADLRAYRVYCLIRAGLSLQEAEDVLPKLFKLSATGARRIVSAASSRYEVELAESVYSLVTGLLDDAEWNEDRERWVMMLPPGLAKERILTLARNSAQPDPMRRAGASYDFPDETLQWVRAQFGLDTKAIPKE